MTPRRLEFRPDVRPLAGAPGVTPTAPRAAAHPLLQLQRAHGNQYVQQQVQEQRGAVEVGAADSVHEREADRVADRIMRKVSSSGAAAGDGGEAGPPPSRGALGGAGGARNLPDGVRSRFEGAFGADLSGVRVHTGPNADRLNRGLGSLAFTHGTDVYFGAGQYAPDTRAGQHLLAHELTHVVQQGGAGGLVQRRMRFERPTNWADATSVQASEGGAGGVLFVRDADAAADPLILKVAQPVVTEDILAGRFQTTAHQRGGNDRRPGSRPWQVATPNVRAVEQPLEGQEIVRVLRPLAQALPAGPGAARAQRMVDRADRDGAVVYSFAGGQEWQDASMGQTPAGAVVKHTQRQKWRPWERTWRAGSGFALLEDRDFVYAMGRTTVADIFSGNFDRIPEFNPGNLKIDQANRRINLIDNVYAGGEWYAFHDVGDEHLSGTVTPMSAEGSLGEWSRQAWARNLRNDRFREISKEVGEWVGRRTKGADSGLRIREQDRALIRSTWKQASSVFERGLRDGKAALIRGMTDAAIQAMVGQVPAADREKATEMIRTRTDFLSRRIDLV